MNDDLERQLDEFYRKLDGSARRVEARWKSTPVGGSRAVAAWLAAGVAAAATILLVISALRSDPRPSENLVINVTPQPIVEPVRRTPPPAPAPAPKDLAPAPQEPTPEAPRTEPPRPPDPAPEAPKPAPPAPPEPKPEPPKSDVTPTVVRGATMRIRETEGTFDLADRSVRGKQKDLEVAFGARLRASTPVKLTLADDRQILLAPRSVAELRPEEKRLSVSLEQGELLADLVGPGPEVRVVTRTCEVVPLGTVFGVRTDGARAIVTVEKGRVEVQSPKGRATLKAAESLQAAEDGSLGAPVPADFRPFSWARSHRAAEMTIFSEDFSKPGIWVGEVVGGVARAVPKPGSGATLQIAVDKPGLFEVPVRGSLTVVYRSDRAGRFKIQMYSPELKTTYTRQNLPVLRGDRWSSVTVDFDDFVVSDKSRPTRMTPGAPVTDILLMYGEEGERGNFWVDSIKVTEARP